MSRRKTMYPIWLIASLTLFPAAGLFALCLGVAAGKTVSVLVVGGVAALVGSVVKQVLAANNDKA